MDVTTAVKKRKSIRGFLHTPVTDDLLEELLTKAARAPSGGNVQPWRICLLYTSPSPRDVEESRMPSSA